MNHHKSPLTPTEFLKFLEDGRSEEIERCTVLGNVHLGGVPIEKSVRALYVTFEGEVHFSDAAFQGTVDLTGCTFAKTLSFRNAEIDGSLVLEDVAIKNEPSPNPGRFPDLAPLDLTGLVVRGDLELDKLTVAYGSAMPDESDGSLYGRGLEVEGSLSALGCEIDGVFDIGNARISGDLNIGSLYARERSAAVNGYFRRGIQAKNARIEGLVGFAGLQSGADVQLWGATISSSVFIMPLVMGGGRGKECVLPYIAGDLNLAAAKINGHVQLESVTIAGEVTLLTTECGHLHIRIFDDLCAGYMPSTLGRLSIRNSTVRGGLSLEYLRVTGGKRDRGQRGVEIFSSTIGGNIRLWSPSPFEGEAASAGERPDPADGCAVIAGDFEITSGTTVGGMVDLTNAAVEGAVKLIDSEVTDDVVFRSRLSGIGEFPPGHPVGASLREGKTLKAAAACLELSMLKCQNDIDLTGLALRAGGYDRSDGSIQAKGLSVKGELTLHARWSDDEVWTEVPGFADFSNLEAAKLIISAHSFDNESATDDDVERCGLLLSGAKIGELEVVAAAQKRPADYRFPVPINLRDIQVEVWSIGDPKLPRPERFKKLLQGDPHFRRPTYLAIERWLRNRGHEREADRIYRFMQREAREQTKKDAWGRDSATAANSHDTGQPERAGEEDRHRSLARGSWFQITMVWLGWLLHFPYDKLLGFGTSPGRLLLVVIVLWGLMLPAYFVRENFEPSMIALAASDAALSRNEAPSAKQWARATPIFVSFNYHIPIVALGVREEWELRDSGRLCWRTCAFVRVPVLTPEDWGVLVTLLNWILWPLILTFAIRKVLRTNAI